MMHIPSTPSPSSTCTSPSTPSPCARAQADSLSELTSLDGQPYKYPAPVYVQNTFVQCVTRSPSLDEFYQQRQIHSSPANCVSQPIAASPMAHATDALGFPINPIYRISEDGGSITRSRASTGDVYNATQTTQAPAVHLETSGVGYATMSANAESSHLAPCQDAYSGYQEACQQQMMQYTSASYTQPGYVVEYALQPSLPQNDVYYHEHQMLMGQPLQSGMPEGLDTNRNLTSALLCYGDPMSMGQSGVQQVASTGRNSSAQDSGQMFTESAFNGYHIQCVQPSAVCYSQEYACPPPPPLPQQPPYESQPGDHMAYAQMNAGGQQGLQVDAAGFPRLVLQLSAAINEQQQQQQQQQSQQLQQADYLPPPNNQITGPTDAIPSIGSIAHESGRCKPCAFRHTKGCENGFNCQFCHICEPGEKKQRRKDKLESRRTVRQVRALAGGLSAWWGGMRGGGQNDQNSLPDLHGNQ